MVNHTFKKPGFALRFLKIPKPSSRTLKPLNNAATINKTKYAVYFCASFSKNLSKKGAFKNKKLIIVNHAPIVRI